MYVLDRKLCKHKQSEQHLYLSRDDLRSWSLFGPELFGNFADE